MVIEQALAGAGKHTSRPNSLGDVRAADAWARAHAADTIRTLPSS
jgi:hypothetical protein